MGGLVGMLPALGPGPGFSYLIKVPFVFNPGSNGIAFLFSDAGGVLFGYTTPAAPPAAVPSTHCGMRICPNQ